MFRDEDLRGGPEAARPAVITKTGPERERVRATAGRPIVRCVPHEDFAASRALVEPWAAQIARWIGEGKRPYFFMHAPDDTFAPENAYAFHAMVNRIRDVGELPAWPGSPRQLALL